MKIVWSEAKAIKIAIEHPDREYTFEQVAEAIISWNIIDIIENKQHPWEEIFIVSIDWYPVASPFIERDWLTILKTFYPVREFKKNMS